MVNWDLIKGKLKSGAAQTARGFKAGVGEVKGFVTAPVPTGKGKKTEPRWKSIAGSLAGAAQGAFNPPVSKSKGKRAPSSMIDDEISIGQYDMFGGMGGNPAPRKKVHRKKKSGSSSREKNNHIHNHNLPHTNNTSLPDNNNKRMPAANPAQRNPASSLRLQTHT